MISNCGHDENNRYSGGIAGDQTGQEWVIRTWYNRPWNCVLRHPDAKVRKLLSDLAVKAANNNKIGYDQAERYTYWSQLQKANYDPSKITVACETDCSEGIISNTKAVGYLLGIDNLKNINATCTGDMRSTYKEAGFKVLTDSKYLTSDAYLLEGDILLNDLSHVATNVTNGSKSGVHESTPNTNTYRVRKSWNDASSQIGAFTELDNAKKECKPGYTVYDSNGKAVYSVADTNNINKIPDSQKLYRVRKKWENSSSQIGAYSDLENAKKSCPVEYSVYDWNGKVVFTLVDTTPESKRLYRIRKKWEDSSSQIGAYKVLDNAKKACKPGYTVYDWNGKALYSK